MGYYVVFWASRAALSVPCGVELPPLDKKGVLLLTPTDTCWEGRSGEAEKGGGKREAVRGRPQVVLCPWEGYA